MVSDKNNNFYSAFAKRKKVDQKTKELPFAKTQPVKR